jgi:opacity protein-like surface antigen
MKLNPIPLASLSLMLLVAATANAQERAWYATALLGAASQSSQSLAFSGPGGPAAGPARYGAGLFSGAALGRSLGDGWRLEGEFSYQSTELDGAPFSGPAGPAGKGNHAATALAVNLLKEFDLGGRPQVRTYLGAGLVRLTEVDIDFSTAGQPERSYSGSGGGWQLLAGARYDLGERWFVDAGLRWLQTSRLRLQGESGAEGQVEARFQPWALTASLGWRF